ncbi:MAG: aminotransferase class I/II-fold pyridoxal phosphate-dependent enzyme [Oscillospiraceae bacterium]|nr:aminotransferase class I/II-fold pyridoxal phosphate-dependent enzyme [Oscillospiraceae bacterium]
MPAWSELSGEDLHARQAELQKTYESYRQKGLQLNMARGVPGLDQLDLSEGLLTAVTRGEACKIGGVETRTYGVPDGLPEAKTLMAAIMDTPPETVIVGGNSSLNLMFDTIARAMTHGMGGGTQPWIRQGSVKFLCPSPGYDRHFSVCEHFGIEMIPVDMRPDGPDMAAVRSLVADPAVKGMWCIPRFSNPQGYVYSDETVHAIAALTPAASDFRVFWDNAYAVHALYEDAPALAGIWQACARAGHLELVIQFASTSKVTFPGAGISALAAGPQTLAHARQAIFFQTIGFDKLNQLRHVRYLGDIDGVRAHMCRHAALLRPKFETVDRVLSEGLAGIASWYAPRGGYFVSLELTPGTARRTVALMGEAGVIMTGAGATWPYQCDPHDADLRIAPTYPSVDELRVSMELLCVCAKLAYVEKRLEERKP